METNDIPCPECGAPMELKHIAIHFERNGFSADVNDVPARVCTKCGTEIIPGPTAEEVGRIVEMLFEAAQALPERLPFTSLSFQRLAA